MTQTWYPLAERDPHDDVGPFVAGAPERGVLHTTESGHFPTYRPGTHPHFTVWLDDTGKVHVTQHVPIDHASAALVHASGQIDTNREGAIQIEIAWYAAQISTAPRPLLDATRKLMRWIESQTAIVRQTVPFKAYPASYGASNGVRMSVAQWKAFRGWCGHQHVPENDHGDPGAIDIKFLLQVDQPLSVPLWWHRSLRAGMTGVDVLACKRRLRRLGYPGISLSPAFGPAVVKAVERLQAAQHLPVIGVVDRPTAHAIRTAIRTA